MCPVAVENTPLGRSVLKQTNTHCLRELRASHMAYQSDQAGGLSVRSVQARGSVITFAGRRRPGHVYSRLARHFGPVHALSAPFVHHSFVRCGAEKENCPSSLTCVRDISGIHIADRVMAWDQILAYPIDSGRAVSAIYIADIQDFHNVTAQREGCN
jgi:hypothetical protein